MNLILANKETKAANFTITEWNSNVITFIQPFIVVYEERRHLVLRMVRLSNDMVAHTTHFTHNTKRHDATCRR